MDKLLSCFYILSSNVGFLVFINMKMTVSLTFSPQDAHELFHVLTSSLEEERERQPRVAHLFDMQTLEVNLNGHC